MNARNSAVHLVTSKKNFFLILTDLQNCIPETVVTAKQLSS